MLRRLSIKARLLVVSILLIAILAASTLYTTANLAANSHAVLRTAELSEIGHLVSDIRNTFGEYRYWLTDLSVSLLRQSELNANATRQRLSGLLDELRPYRPDAAAIVDKEVTQFQTAAMQAVEEYTEDRRVVGNTYLAAARQHSVAINARLTSLFDDVNHEAMQARNQVLADVVETTRVAMIGVALAILVGIGATILVLRSISRPLGDVVAAMAAVTAGNLDAAIPAGGARRDWRDGTHARSFSRYRDRAEALGGRGDRMECGARAAQRDGGLDDQAISHAGGAGTRSVARGRGASGKRFERNSTMPPTPSPPKRATQKTA